MNTFVTCSRLRDTLSASASTEPDIQFALIMQDGLGRAWPSGALTKPNHSRAHFLHQRAAEALALNPRWTNGSESVRCAHALSLCVSVLLGTEYPLPQHDEAYGSPQCTGQDDHQRFGNNTVGTFHGVQYGECYGSM